MGPPEPPDPNEANEANEASPAVSRRVRAGMRRHGLSPRPAAIRSLVDEQELRITEGNRVDLFEFGRPALESMLAAIETAERRVHLETYILRPDATGDRFIQALARRARAGVEVRLLYDAFGSLGLDDGRLAELRASGGQVLAFNPLRRIYPRWAPRRRDHRKILCVDGCVAFAGGLNIGDEYWGVGDTPWRDTQLRIEGPAVRDLEAVFLESWFRADGPDLAWHEVLLDPPPAISGEIRVAVVADGPVYRRRRMRDLVVQGLRDAVREVRLASPYFAPGRRVLKALGDVGDRADVDLVLAGTTDHPILRRAAHALLPRLLASGVRVYEFEASVMHAKVALFDRRWAIVGSSNLDRQSFEHSYEVNLVLEGGDIAGRIAAMFDDDLARSTQVDEASLARRGAWDRILDACAALVLRLI